MIRKISVAVLPLVLLLSLSNAKAGDKNAPGKQPETLTNAAKTEKPSSKPGSRSNSPKSAHARNASEDFEEVQNPLTNTVRPGDIAKAAEHAADNTVTQPAVPAAFAAIDAGKIPQPQIPLSAQRPPALTTSDSPANRPAPVSSSSSSAFSSSTSSSSSSSDARDQLFASEPNLSLHPRQPKSLAQGPVHVNTNVSPTANMISVDTAYTPSNIALGLASKPKESIQAVAALLEGLQKRSISPTSRKLLAGQQETIGEILNPRQDDSRPRQGTLSERSESKSSLTSQSSSSSSSSSSASAKKDGKGGLSLRELGSAAWNNTAEFLSGLGNRDSKPDKKSSNPVSKSQQE